MEYSAEAVTDLDGCYAALGFSAPPFRITPDIEFLVPHEQYLEAIGHLRFGLMSGGFTLLTGEVGLGKTLLCRYLLHHLPVDTRTAYVFNPQQSYAELLGAIIYDLGGGVPDPGASSAQLHEKLFGILAKHAASGTRVALLIDEAHRLQPELLEGLRLLSNLETDKRKLISLLLVGQSELEQTLKLSSMRALSQRISVWHRLRPLKWRESADYIRQRLQMAHSGDFEITDFACLIAHRYARGVPRRLNQICDRALLAAFTYHHKRVGAGLMRRAAREVVGLALD
ncbi:MAG: AAA family ATPase [Candidatus Sedimenticola sp. (ex Thyasira tokunagai)]